MRRHRHPIRQCRTCGRDAGRPSTPKSGEHRQPGANALLNDLRTDDLASLSTPRRAPVSRMKSRESPEHLQTEGDKLLKQKN
jgi:hypothetical protein